MYGDQGQGIVRRILHGNDAFDKFGFNTLHKIVLGFEPKDLQTVLDATTDSINIPVSLGRTAIFWAVIFDNTEHVQLLLEYDADPSASDLRGFTPMDFVRGPSVCESLLARGGRNNINPQNFHHSSLHEHVIENGCAEVISLFAAANFDIDIKDQDNETPLLNAIYAGQTAVVKRLIELGADANSANISSRDSAIHFAASFDRPEILKLLLDKGADYTVLGCNGRNLAHRAARAGSREMIKIMARADLSILDFSLGDYEARTPADYMNERIVMTDLEVGVHEAWEELVAKLPPLPPYDSSKVDKKVAQEFKVPGAFPTIRVQEVEVDTM